MIAANGNREGKIGRMMDHDYEKLCVPWLLPYPNSTQTRVKIQN